MKQRIVALFNFLGWDIYKGWSNIKGLSFFRRDKAILKKQLSGHHDFPFAKNHPILDERSVEAGTMSGHYFHQDLHVAQRILKYKPERHVDLGSRIDGFVAHVATFREIEVLDIRPQNSKVKNIQFRQQDLMELPEELISYCDSFSSLHAIEHFGLGRYNDPIDANGHLKAVQNIAKIIKPNGVFYFSVPIGPQRIEFNAHRVFSIAYLLALLKTDFELIHFSYVDDQGDFHKHVPLKEVDLANNFGCYYGCGIFELRRI
jgi:SAM-dependent methyltransferase